MAVCPSCSKDNPYTSTFCPYCGKHMSGGQVTRNMVMDQPVGAARPNAPSVTGMQRALVASLEQEGASAFATLQNLPAVTLSNKERSSESSPLHDNPLLDFDDATPVRAAPPEVVRAAQPSQPAVAPLHADTVSMPAEQVADKTAISPPPERPAAGGTPAAPAQSFGRPSSQPPANRPTGAKPAGTPGGSRGASSPAPRPAPGGKPAPAVRPTSSAQGPSAPSMQDDPTTTAVPPPVAPVAPVAPVVTVRDGGKVRGTADHRPAPAADPARDATAGSFESDTTEPEAGRRAREQQAAAASSVFVASGGRAASLKPVVATPGAAPNTCPGCRTPMGSASRFCSQCGTCVDPNAPASVADRAAAAIKQTQFFSALEIREALKNKNRLVVLNDAGEQEMQYSINAAQTMCGREHGLVILDDPYVSPAHCVFRFNNEVLSVEDSGSLNGVFLRLRGDAALEPGDCLRVGRHTLRVDLPEAFALPPPELADGDDARTLGRPAAAARLRLVEVLDGGALGDSWLFRDAEMVLGRVGAHAVLEDESVSARHCAVSLQGGLAVLKDLESTNGTFLRIKEEHTLEDGDVLLIGQHRLRVDIQS